MTVFETNITSTTGYFFYSDQTWKVREGICYDSTMPSLNFLASIPLIGRLAGLIRIAFALIHIVGHSLAFPITQKKGHLYHVVKGVAELGRGIIESLPFIGEAFSWAYNPSISDMFNIDYQFRSFAYVQKANFFLVKIYNPERPDIIDKLQGRAPAAKC